MLFHLIAVWCGLSVCMSAMGNSINSWESTIWDIKCFKCYKTLDITSTSCCMCILRGQPLTTWGVVKIGKKLICLQHTCHFQSEGLRKISNLKVCQKNCLEIFTRPSPRWLMVDPLWKIIWYQSMRNSPDLPDMSGKGIWSRWTKWPARINQGQCTTNKSQVAGHFYTVKSLATIQHVRRRTESSQDKMCGEVQINFAFSVICKLI